MRFAPKLVMLACVLCVACVDELPTLTGEIADGGLDVALPGDANLDVPIDAGSAELGRRIAAATDHTCAILGEGELWCWGANDGGQLGRPGPGTDQPERIEAGRVWVEVSGRALHTCARDSEGALFCWGNNELGQLGQGDFVSRDTPTMVVLSGAVAHVTAGYDQTCAITVSGELWCWGENFEGQLGLDDRAPGEPEPSPLRIGVETDWIAVRSGQGHTCGLRSAGTLFCWGRNSNSQLGLGPGAPIQRRFPTQVDDERWLLGVAGQSHSCGILRDGRIACWGDNSHGQLGTGDLMTRFTPTIFDGGGNADMDTDTFHGCTIAAGQLRCWGRNVEGQLGTLDTVDQRAPVVIGSFTDWEEIGVGRFHTCGLRSGGTLWCTGANETGKLGVGDTARRKDFTKVWPVPLR